MVNFARLLYYLARAKRRLYWDRDKLRRYQEKRLGAVVRYAYDYVPFYHEKFRSAGVKPDDVKCLDDLSKLPLVKKSELRQVPPRQRVSAKFDVDRLKAIRTSGSTGEPFTTYVCGRENDWRKAIYMRANISCGQQPRDRWVVITAPHHFHDTTGIQRRLGLYAQTCVSVFSSADEQIRLISKLRPDVLDGYSGALLLLAKELDRRKLESIRPRMVFGSADLMDADSRQFMERVYGASFLDQFGCAEIDRSAWQCPEKVGYHMDLDSVVTEFVDEGGDEVSAGERGDVVYTSLFNFAMPFIRYSVGDVGVPSSEECPCGRTLPLMGVVEGRRDSFLVLPDDRLLSPMVLRNALSEFFEKIVQYRVVQKRVDLLEIYVKKRAEVADDAGFASELVAQVKLVAGFGDDVEVDVKLVDDMPLSKTGKLMAIVSELSR